MDDVGDAAAVAARRLERFVRNRLAAMSPPATALAEAVAVFEDEVPVHLAAALARVDLAVSSAAVDSGGLQPNVLGDVQVVVGVSFGLADQLVLGSRSRCRSRAMHRRRPAALL